MTLKYKKGKGKKRMEQSSKRLSTPRLIIEIDKEFLSN
jgi:hypothetical protein